MAKKRNPNQIRLGMIDSSLLIIGAEEYLKALDMSDPDHKDFADSGADVVEHLWRLGEQLRAPLSRIVRDVRRQQRKA